MRSKIFIAAIVLAAIVGIGVGVGLLAGHNSGTTLPVANAQDSKPDTTPTAAPPTHSTPAAPRNFTERTSAPVEIPPVVQAPPVTVAATNVSDTDTNFEDKIDDIIGSDDADTNKVKQLFALFPSLPPDGQEEVVQHLSNLVDDDDYKPLGDLLKDAKLPEGVLDELLADVLNRPNNLKLPLLLDVASNPDHAKHDEAKDLLELYLGDDYGGDWDAWKKQVTKWLQDNPE